MSRIRQLIVCPRCGKDGVFFLEDGTIVTHKAHGPERKDCSGVVTRDSVNHPAHYQAKNDPDGTYEAIKVIEAWGLGFCLGNTVKYISRAGKKDPAKTIEDLKKSAWYLNREIERLEKGL